MALCGPSEHAGKARCCTHLRLCIHSSSTSSGGWQPRSLSSSTPASASPLCSSTRIRHRTVRVTSTGQYQRWGSWGDHGSGGGGGGGGGGAGGGGGGGGGSPGGGGGGGGGGAAAAAAVVVRWSANYTGQQVQHIDTKRLGIVYLSRGAALDASLLAVAAPRTAKRPPRCRRDGRCTIGQLGKHHVAQYASVCVHLCALYRAVPCVGGLGRLGWLWAEPAISLPIETRSWAGCLPALARPSLRGRMGVLASASENRREQGGHRAMSPSSKTAPGKYSFEAYSWLDKELRDLGRTDEEVVERVAQSVARRTVTKLRAIPGWKMG